MNSGIIGKIVYFWIFMIGGLFAAKIFGFASDGSTLVLVLILCAILYVAFIIAQSKGKARAKAGKNQGAKPACSQAVGKKKKK